MNEQKLNSVDKLLDLFKMMKTEDQLSFVFEREGRLITYKVSVHTVK